MHGETVVHCSPNLDIMTLDDFFTLTEMNNGLTAASRVRELMAVMQKERDCIVKNAADSTRQRSAVASAIAATENKDCLDLFLQLDGLHFISSWLKDAQKLSNDTTDSFMEEYITHLLRALEKLHVDYEKSVGSEILTTVESFLVHSSSKVQDKARVLFESWKTKRGVDASLSDADKAVDETRDSADIRRDIGHSESSPRNASISREKSPKDNGDELARDDIVLSTSSDAVHPDQVESAYDSKKILDPPIGDERPLDHVGSSSDAVAEMKAVSELNSNAGSKNPCDEGLSYIDSRKNDLDGKSAANNGSDANQCGTSNALIPKESGDVNHRLLPKSSSTEKSWGKFLSGIADDGKANAFNSDDLANNYTFSKKQTDRESDRASKKSDVEIDYGIVDPLEVARQVAMEVEREIVDYRERSCSSSEKLPESNSGKLSHDASDGSPMEVANDPNSSDESSTSSENLDTNGTKDVATSQVTEAVAQEEANTDKGPSPGPCNFFDLNQEMFSEDCDRPGNQFSATVSVVSASRAAAAAPKLPGAPLQFEGNLGWKGSAVTSAFRPASPRRSDKDFSNSSSSKQRQGCLDFDLNVTESVDESSVETNSKRSEHLELDLNRTSEDGGALLDWRIGNFFPQAQSSSNQPTRNIDLNDQPSFFNVKASQNFNVKSDDTAISIMGTRVEVNRNRDFISQTPALQNSQTPELAFDINLGRTGNFIGIGSAIPYTHSSVYGYNNFAPGPTMPFSGPLYGPARPIPYMVDARGAPVIPQIMGSASPLPNAFSQPPFVINANGSAHPKDVGPSRSSFDLNSGMLVESGSKDPAGLGLFLNSVQVRPIHEHISQPTMSSAVGGKRKEPENGYEFYPFKHYTTPPWKQS